LKDADPAPAETDQVKPESPTAATRQPGVAQPLAMADRFVALQSGGVLNCFRADPSHLRILVISTPKTGNMWVRSLLHYAYGIPVVEIPPDWNPASIGDLGPSWVGHQHFIPTEELVRTLMDERVSVVTTIRHPGDTLVSYIHYLSWWKAAEGDAAYELLMADHGQIGANTEEFVRRYFAGIYVRSKSWAELGAHTLRYEDLAADPMTRLRDLTHRIAPVHEDKLRRSVLLCRADIFRTSGALDPRHVRAATTHQWVRELPPPIISYLKTAEPYLGMCQQFGYDWETRNVDQVFDYAQVDPFHGAMHFANHVPISPILVRTFLDDAPSSVREHGDPTTTGPGSYWDWLVSPDPVGALDPTFPGGLLTNLMMVVHRSRPDLQEEFPDPVSRDRLGYAVWFVGTGFSECSLPWDLVKSVREAIIEHFRRSANEGVSPAATIVGGTVSIDQASTDFLGGSLEGKPGDEVRIELRLSVAQLIERPIVGIALRAPDGRTVFGTNTAILGTPLPDLTAGSSYRVGLSLRIMVSPGKYFVSVGLASYEAGNVVVPIHRCYDATALIVQGTSVFGSSWCPTSIAVSDPVAN